jgi:hypothetical protein
MRPAQRPHMCQVNEAESLISAGYAAAARATIRPAKESRKNNGR